MMNFSVNWGTGLMWSAALQLFFLRALVLTRSLVFQLILRCCPWSLLGSRCRGGRPTVCRWACRPSPNRGINGVSEVLQVLPSTFALPPRPGGGGGGGGGVAGLSLRSAQPFTVTVTISAVKVEGLFELDKWAGTVRACWLKQSERP
ncbi:hypothetical protein QBC41DRAFT_119675 [Cercophora samala]|uniref:Uncharacterized protein n=1 Tax=Cercophora samala TaxID=330535 RepID=A0AA39ZCZ4_9PEZI|nr:hypothetical protein QBC41DRAFT_119675 [Cercophora samala]